MCGITGMWNLRSGEPISPERLGRMNDVMIPRGPDDEGTFVDGSFGMAARRLSIIDLAGGHQPIGNEDDSIWVAYNGEIYNFPEIRERLIANGHVFKTRTDTETLVHLYEERGADLVDELNGMFAFAIYDRRKRSLLLARDRVGIKPLFYAYENGTLVFGSDVKSFLLADDTLCDELDEVAIHHFLSLNYIPAPHSIFAKVKALLPGHVLTLDADRGEVVTRRYWDVQFGRSDRSVASLTEELRELLGDAVEKRLLADVPVGVLLSGGLDSSAISALMRQRHQGPVKTFSAHFAEESFSEVQFARQMARHLGTEHFEVEVGPPDEALIRQIAWDAGQPYADSSMIPLRAVCQLAREHVKVALSGDGGDEVFAGYQTYTAYRMANLYRRIPGLVRDGLIRPLVESLPTSDRKISFEYKAKRFVRAAALAPEQAHYEFKVLFDEQEKAALYGERFRNGHRRPSSYGVFASAYEEGSDGGDVLNRLLYVDTKVYLPDDILVKVDRMSMGVSLESRVPLLDHRVVEFAAQLPTALKQRGTEGKWLFKRAIEDLVPTGIRRRKKAGFNVPASRWLKGPLREMVGDYLSESHLRDAGIFSPEAVAKVLETHRSGRSDRSRELFGLLMFHVWHRHVFTQSKVGA